MLLNFLKAKIHKAIVTETDISYNGSISIDQNLLEKSGILPNEKVEIYNITNGARFSTYVIPAPLNSKKIGINGAAARMVQKGDIVIICAYCWLDAEEAKNLNPKILLLNTENEIIETTIT